MCVCVCVCVCVWECGKRRIKKIAFFPTFFFGTPPPDRSNFKKNSIHCSVVSLVCETITGVARKGKRGKNKKKTKKKIPQTRP